MKPVRPRRAYAMMLVLVFIVLFLSIYSVAYRHATTALRIETAGTLQRERDRGSIVALARGLALLETGLPPLNPYVCGVTIDTPTGARSFTVTYTSAGVGSWSVRSPPTAFGTAPQPMPSSFAPASSRPLP